MRFALLLSLSWAFLAEPAPPAAYSVGTTRLMLVDQQRGNRRVTTEIWYPTHQRPNPEKGYADLEPAQGPFPLILFSHGSGATRLQSTYLTEDWARAGYIVAAPDHQNNTFLDRGKSDRARSATERPLDITFLLDRLLEKHNDPTWILRNQIDARRIGAAGHSLGGFTVLVLAGARVDVKAALDRVGRNNREPLDFTTFEHPDPRLRAFIAYAPPGPPLFPPDGLAKIDRPVLVFGATNDQITPYQVDQAPLFKHLTSTSYLATVHGGSHFCFNNPSFTALVRIAKPKMAEELADRSQIDPLVRQLSLAFFDRYVAGRENAAPLASSSPLVTVESKSASPALETSRK